MKLNWFYCWTRPWVELEICHIGPFFLNQGSDFNTGVGLFFVDLGISFTRKSPVEEPEK